MYVKWRNLEPFLLAGLTTNHVVISLTNQARPNFTSVLIKCLEGISVQSVYVVCAMCLSEVDIKALIPLGSIKQEDVSRDGECKINLDKPVLLRLLMSRRVSLLMDHLI